MGVRVAVAGASGYAGGELLRLISDHPDLELGPVTAGANAGAPVTDVHPHLAGLASRTFERAEPDRLAAADLVFMALPHEESAALAAALPASQAIIDLSASFRLADPGDWNNYYQGPHNGRWLYGLPELPGARQQIREATRVAAPGCYATTAILALEPLLASGVADPGDVVIVAASAYQVGGVHRHTPEIEQALGEASGIRPVISFTPMLAPMPRGILATCTARLAAGGGGASAGPPRQALASAYAGEPFIFVLPEGRWPSTAAATGSNAVHLQA